MAFGQGVLLAPLFVIATSLTAYAGTVELVGTGSVPGTASDLSGLTGAIVNAADPSEQVPMNILGGFGSGFAYTGYKDFFIAVSDRGPFDGITDPAYPDRFHIFRFPLDTTGKTIVPTLVDTRLLVDKLGNNFVGESSAFDTAHPLFTYRFDPESVRVSRAGNLFISDEYGPYISQFDLKGKLLHRVRVPEKFLIDHPSGDANTELSGNTKGRQPNRGMEGLAISPSGTVVFGLMQNPLIQDGALDGSLKRVGINTRLLRVDFAQHPTQEFVYQIETGQGGNSGMNDIVAVNDHEFLVIERDGKAGASAATKKIYHIDIAGATDVSGIPSLPTACTAGTDCPFTPVSKTLLIDMLAPEFGLAGASFPEKIEALAFGPDLADGRHVLYVGSDNDLDPTKPSQVYAFAISADLLPGYQPQQIGRALVNELHR